MSKAIEVLPVVGLPEIGEGDPLGQMLAVASDLRDGDMLVVSQKVVSKVEGRIRSLADVEPGKQARELAARLGKDPALVQLVLEETESIVRAESGVLITKTRSGWICANAGVDSSNVVEDGCVTLLPVDPDASARRLRSEVRAASGHAPAVVISDSFGRPWRLGQSDVAIGCAGIAPLEDWRGRLDRTGRELAATVVALVDEIAAAADLVREKNAGVPAAVVRGLGERVTDEDGPGAAVVQRPAPDDLFR